MCNDQLEEWWEYAAYLSWRGPIAIGINMFTGFGSFTEFSKPVPQARRAAEIVRYTIEYHHLLLSESIAPGKSKKFKNSKTFIINCRNNVATCFVYEHVHAHFCRVSRAGGTS